MADRALRGSGLGSKSHADPNGVELAPRQEVGFDCPKGHHFEKLTLVGVLEDTALRDRLVASGIERAGLAPAVTVFSLLALASVAIAARSLARE